MSSPVAVSPLSPSGNLSYAINKPTTTHATTFNGTMVHCLLVSSHGEMALRRDSFSLWWGWRVRAEKNRGIHLHSIQCQERIVWIIESVSGKIRVPPPPTLLWLRRLGCSLWWRTRRIREHKKVKGMILKASITFNCRGLKEQMSIWESGRFVCVRQDAMPFLIIKILIFKKIRNKQPLRKWHWNDNYYKKINWKFLSPVFSSPRKHCRGRTRGRGISKEKRGLLIRENDLM